MNPALAAGASTPKGATAGVGADAEPNTAALRLTYTVGASAAASAGASANSAPGAAAYHIPGPGAWALTRLRAACMRMRFLGFNLGVVVIW